MDVKNRLTQSSNRNRYIYSLPIKVARVEVNADAVANRLPQFQRRFSVVDHESRVRFESDFRPMIVRELRSLSPIRTDLLLPLPFQYVEKLRWPWTRNPVGVASHVAVSRTARKRNNDGN